MPHAASTDTVEQITVVLADDHQIVLDGLRVLLESEPGMKVVATAVDGEAAIRHARELTPDVVVMDLRMPNLDGIAATREILERFPATRVVVLSAETDIRSVDAILRAGASGYVTKQRAFGEFVQAIRTVMRGKIYLSREVARLVTSGAVSAPTAPPRRARDEVNNDAGSHARAAAGCLHGGRHDPALVAKVRMGVGAVVLTEEALTPDGVTALIVQQLVELIGGTIKAESAGPGKGATFTVHLPISSELER